MAIVLSVSFSIFFTGGAPNARADSTGTATVANNSLAMAGTGAAGVCLTFDDEYVDDWYNYARPLLQEYNAKATFFLCDFSSYSDTQYQELAALQSDGDEMACHTVNHLDVVQYLTNHTMDQYINDEVLPEVQEMDAKGMHPTDFAYPFGSYNDVSNAALEAYFDHVRIITPYDVNQSWVDPTFQMAYYKFNNERVLGAIELDNIEAIPLDQIYGLMDSVKANNTVIIFFAHDTLETTASDYYLPPSRLESILQYANSIGLKFYTMNELQTQVQSSTTISLNASWTLMSLPLVNTTLMASGLGSSVRRVSAYNNTTKGYDTYTAGYSATDMQLKPDTAYFVDSSRANSFKLYGTAEASHNITLHPEWNAVGWTNNSTIKASTLAGRLADIQRICRYNASSGSFDTYVKGYSTSDKDFNIKPGEGYFIYLNSAVPEQLKIGGST